MPVLKNKFYTDYIDLIDQQIYGLQGQRGIPGKPAQIRDALYAIIYPNDNRYSIHKEATKHIEDLFNLLRDKEEAEFYGCETDEEIRAFQGIVLLRIANAIDYYTNKTDEELELLANEGMEKAEEQPKKTTTLAAGEEHIDSPLQELQQQHSTDEESSPDRVPMWFSFFLPTALFLVVAAAGAISGTVIAVREGDGPDRMKLGNISKVFGIIFGPMVSGAVLVPVWITFSRRLYAMLPSFLQTNTNNGLVSLTLDAALLLFMF